MRVLLLDLYLLEIDRIRREERSIIQPYLYLGAYLDWVGIEHDLFRWYGDEEELAHQLRQGDYQFVFINLIIGPVLQALPPACQVIRAVSPRTKIWVGGTAVYFLQDQLAASPYIDHVSLGHPRKDPAHFFQELHTHGLVRGNAPAGFPLLAGYRHLPAFVHEHVRPSGGFVRSINLSTASGCTNGCSFCYLGRTPGWQQSPEEALAELMALHTRHDIGYFELSDDNFLAHPARLDRLTSLLAQHQLKIDFFCLASVDTIHRDRIDRLVKNGLQRIFVGVDGISARSLRLFNKAYTRERIFAAIALLREYPIDLTLAVVLGAFGEKPDEVQELYDWVAGLEPEICAPQFLTAYPGSPLFEQALTLGYHPPQTLAQWGKDGDLCVPKAYSCTHIDADRYRAWERAFEKLGTRHYRSEIGESRRRWSRPGETGVV